MPFNCCVPNCEFKYFKSNTLFGLPKDNGIKDQWEKVLGISFKKSHRVCDAHFKDSDIVSHWESGEGLNKYTVRKIILM